MRRSLAAGLLAVTLGTAAAEPVALESWGSFHVGGREVVVSGQPVREVLMTPGGVPARLDPNGTYLMGSMYAQYVCERTFIETPVPQRSYDSIGYKRSLRRRLRRPVSM
jgi:hypothetical protein